MSSALIVFAKRPSPGRVKTRLTPFVSAEDAASLYRAFLYDALDSYERVGPDVRLYVAPGGGPQEIHPNQFEQRGDGLGERMLNAFADTFAAGYARAVVIGTDHPTLPSAFIEKAFDELEVPARVVLGPAEDGGYYLLGMNDLRPALFRGMTFSHPNVFDHTVDRAVDAGASLSILPMWYDVDTPDDLMRLLKERPDEAAAPRTRSVLGRLSTRYALGGS